MSNEYKGYGLFNDVQDPTLRAWNRAATMFNFMRDQKEVRKSATLGELCNEYARQFDKQGIQELLMMYRDIKARGLGIVRKEVMSSVEVH